MTRVRTSQFFKVISLIHLAVLTGLVNVIKTAGWICQSKLQSKVTFRQLLSCVVLWRMDFRINCRIPRRSKILDCEYQGAPLCHKWELSQRPKGSEYAPPFPPVFPHVLVRDQVLTGKPEQKFKDSAPLYLGFFLKLLCFVHNKLYFFAGSWKARVQFRKTEKLPWRKKKKMEETAEDGMK